MYILRHALAHMELAWLSQEHTGVPQTSTDLSPGCSARWEIKVGAGWAYCQRHNEVTEQKLPKVLPSCYESAENDGKDADDDVQGVLFPVTDKYMVS